MLIRKLYCLLLALVLAAPPLVARAARPGLEAHVPAGYDLTVRLDLAQILRGEALEPLRAELIRPEHQLAIDEFFYMTGLDLLADLDEALLAGYFDDTREEDGLLLLRGRFDRAGLVDFLAQSPEYGVERVAGHEVYGFWSEDDGEMRYACFLEPGLVAVGREQPVHQAAQAAGGTTPRLAEQPDYAARLAAAPEAPLALALALPPVEAAPEADLGQALLAQFEAGAAWLGIDDGKLASGLEIAARDADAARQAAELIEGLAAFAALAVEQPLLGRLARQVQVQSNGSSTRAEAALPLDQAPNLLATLGQLKHKR